jgi:hypothetical protein
MVIDSASRLFTKKRVVEITGIIIILVFSALLIEDESDLWKHLFTRTDKDLPVSHGGESETRNGAIALPQTAELFSNRQTFLWLMNNQPTYILPPCLTLPTGRT